MILSVNVDHVATLRQARGGMEPDPLMAAALAVLGGADGITIHLREDRRHIQDRDLTLLRQTVNVPFNLEMAATEEMIAIALDKRPDMVTLVPEKRQEITTEGGLDVAVQKTHIAEAVKRLQGEGIPVSLFINPNRTDVDISAEVQAMMIEVHTGLYSNAMTYEEVALELDKIKNSVARALHNGLIVNAGHGLNYHNILPIVAIKSFRGLYIGHSIVSRAVMVGMQQAVSQMKEFIK
ncbi:MAG: pyridoxine 5'-phosphate synthase [Nitrospirae bacterium]|uniref:pyridoxine 5'-phosphate synthase n=1 Tax=Candidatus Magnetobacterium casense TaxID=1455061 RepID=UPI00059056D0|nr:pyridoxine 5'-phosphate synthase [Candidatus Magnetobacterium casensis]MBF0337923.1 pyridoxine 5'-phosphate synthase [Nitrospirota bacterium]